MIEVLVALAILSVAGLATVRLVSEGLWAVEHAVAVERRVADEDRLLTAYALLNRRDLGSRVGVTRVGPYDVRIERGDLALFRVTIGLPGAPADLGTVLYRPEARDAE